MGAVTRGRFITFEGGEGTGKSTQARRLAERLRAAGREVVLTREPGGTPGAEEIRGLLVEGAAERWSALTEALLLNAARADHLERLIRPAIARGAWVVCDRFADSTRAYQGAGGGVGDATLAAIEAVVVDDTRPDLTLLLDAPAALGLARAEARGGAARFEGKGLAFHERLREGFQRTAGEPRFVVIDASLSEDAVADAVWTAVEARWA